MEAVFILLRQTLEVERSFLEILNDGLIHSVQSLTEQLGIGRDDVLEMIRRLGERGVDIERDSLGYRLTRPLEFLDSAQIFAYLADEAQDLIQGIEIHSGIDSTNAYLMERAESDLASGSVCLAEWQSAGRGRRGRAWVSPYAANLYLSLLWRFRTPSSALSGLSLAAGIAVTRVLHGLGATEVGLKWPNDLLWRGCKLGGLLLEFRGRSSGPCQVVAGVGLNVSLSKGVAYTIDQPWADLRDILGSERISRNRLAAGVISEMALTFARFQRGEFGSLVQAWAPFDLLQGHRVRLSLPNTAVIGIARGVTETGALLLETDTGMRQFVTGEISVRLLK